MYDLLILGWFSVLYGLIPSCMFIIFDIYGPKKTTIFKKNTNGLNFTLHFKKFCSQTYQFLRNIQRKCKKLVMKFFYLIHPVCLFHPVRLLISWKGSTLYDYSILYLYSVLKSIRKTKNSPLASRFNDFWNIGPHSV